MKKTLTRVLLAVSALSLLLFTSGGHTASALPKGGSDIYYYDANWNLIGERYQDCSGGITMWGTKDGVVYEYADTWDCTGGTPGENGCCYTDPQGNCIGTVNCNYF
jgi:hypothetical protein